VPPRELGVLLVLEVVDAGVDLAVDLLDEPRDRLDALPPLT
jgi:hypothetical protein